MTEELKKLLEKDLERLNSTWLGYWHKSEFFSKSNPRAWAHAVIDWLAYNGYEVVKQQPPKDSKNVE